MKNRFIDVKSMIITVILFFYFSILSWLAFFDITPRPIGYFSMVPAISLVLILIISYWLSRIIITYFEYEYIKKIPLSVKFIILLLIVKFFYYSFKFFDHLLYDLLYPIPIFEWEKSYNIFDYFSKSFFPSLILIVLFISIIFLLIKHKFSFKLGSLAFILFLLLPEGIPYFYSLYSYYYYPETSIFELFSSSQLRYFLVELVEVLFYITIIVYLFIRNYLKEKKPHTIFLIIFSVFFLVINFQIIQLIIVGRTRIYYFGEYIDAVLFFGTLFGLHFLMNEIKYTKLLKT